MVLHYQEYGDKSAPVIIFVHGGGVSDWMWDKQIKHFTHYHCIVPILPEHGKENNEIKFSIKGSAEELIRLTEEKASGKKVILIGFSLGSQIIIQMLSLNPHLIDIAILNSPSVRPFLTAKKLIKPTIKVTFPLIKFKWFSKLQAKTLYISEDYFEEYYEESCQMSPDTLVRILEENMSFSIPNDFRKATSKILITVGEKEKAIMKKSVTDIIEANSNSVGVIIPGIGHGVSLANPNFFNQMVEAWIVNGQIPIECIKITKQDMC